MTSDSQPLLRRCHDATAEGPRLRGWPASLGLVGRSLEQDHLLPKLVVHGGSRCSVASYQEKLGSLYSEHRVVMMMMMMVGLCQMLTL